VMCACGVPFCFRCGQEAHDPATCDMLSAWQEKCQSESETANWILANTKKCPKCNCRIEKNQGCNHMNCKMCRFEFCWICMGDWAQHGQNTGGYYKCNKYDPTVTADSTVERAKAELDRYLHYYQRYHGHDSALKFASKQREEAEVRMTHLQEAEKSAWIDVQFIKQAVEQVRRSAIDCLMHDESSTNNYESCYCSLNVSICLTVLFR
jgi:ariadne-1